LILANNCIVIVDPFSAGALLAQALQARGATCIAVQSTPDLPPSMRSRFDPDSFPDIIHHSSDLHDTLSAVQGHQPSQVIAGCESGVELAEYLADRLKLPGNGSELREARRNKFLMAEAVKACGLRTAQQYQSQDPEQIIDWIQRTLDWPVMLKPTKSTASDHVFRCKTADDAADAARQILCERNVLGRRNQTVLVQEFLDGTEYVVDTVSLDGRRKTTALWQYHRPPHSRRFVGYDAMSLLPYDGERQQALRSYAYEVLDALAINFGPAHCELMWVDGEPILVEVGARLNGGINAVLSGICGGLCQLDETVDVILSPGKFRESLHERRELTKRAASIFLIPRRRGRLIRVNGLEKIGNLPTLHSMSVSSRPGDELKKVAGLVVLVGDDLASIERDIDVIRTVERNGLFEVEVTQSSDLS
jgi:biotin carboxylase